ncbi:carbohydrate ABC transporter permease [Pseudarthrobacter sp. NPDC058362]|uniref:carbohydrate ABC transporter permease n=1 Tax=unclassified Pseudarthrobacter TaxID=2647000 RepID=UPI00364ED9CD
MTVIPKEDTTSVQKGAGVFRKKAPAGRRPGKPGRSALTPYLFIGPILLVFLGFYLWPAFSTVTSSLFTWGMLNPWQINAPADWEYVGLENYSSTLTSADFWNAALNSAIWLVVFPTLVLAVSFPLALLVWNARRGSGIFRSIFILPMTISLSAAGIIWSFIYNPDPNKGVLNAFLALFGLEDASFTWGPLELHAGQWLSNPGVLHLGSMDLRLANLFVIIPAVWAFAGFGVITFTAGLTSVPSELLDAARVDGAKQSQLIRHVVIPSLRPSIVVVAVVSVIFALRTFDIVLVTTAGGPAKDTEVLAMLLWRQVFQYLDTPQGGLAAAIAVLMSVFMIAISLPYIRATLKEQQ